MVINSMFLTRSRERSILGHRPFCKGYYFRHFLVDTSRTIFPDTPIWAGTAILFLDFDLIGRFFCKTLSSILFRHVSLRLFQRKGISKEAGLVGGSGQGKLSFATRISGKV